MNLACPNDFYFYGDFLVLQPMEDGLVYGVKDTNGPSTTNPELAGGKVLSFSSDNEDYSFDFGFRLGLGFLLNHDAWNMGMEWMWYRTNQDVSAKAASTGVIIPQWIATQAPVAGDNEASQRWEMQMNVFDIALGKPFHLSRYLVLEPFFGLRAAWIDQNYTARYAGSYDTKFQAKNDFWGVGTRVGCKSEWALGAGFELLAHPSASILYANFDVTENLPSGDDTFTLDHDFYRNNSNLELQLGLAWGTHLNDMQHHIKMQALWEFQTWYDQNQLRKVISNTPAGIYVNDTVPRGDLHLAGVSFRILFDF
ncbi:MAG: Lpg1974 family pore-forming outer membrane protein [Chlamydiota bacterium]